MNLGILPLLILALIMVSTESEADSVELLLQGEHVLQHQQGAMIIGDAEVIIPEGISVSGPVYVIGGEVTVAGKVGTDLVQLAGLVTIASTAAIDDELRVIGGSRSLDPGSEIGRVTGVDLVGNDGGSGGIGVMSTLITSAILALVGIRLRRRRPTALQNIVNTMGAHPAVSLTVGTLVFLTATALLVFMAFTIVLIPIAIIGALAGLVIAAYGIIAWGEAIGSRLPIQREPLAITLGVTLAVVAFRLVPRIPVLGDVVVIAAAFTAFGAVVVTYFGLSPYRLPTLPDR